MGRPSKTLTVKGTIYIDGSVKVEQSWGGQDAARYDGQGTIYMSGSLVMKNANALRGSRGQRQGLHTTRRRVEAE